MLFSRPAGGRHFARLIAQWLSEHLASNSSSRTGRAQVAISPPRRSCGRQQTVIRFLFLCTPTRQRDPLREAQFQFHPRHAVEIIRVPYVLVVNPSFPVKTVPELIAYAKANPGKVNWLRRGRHSLHLAAELFKMLAGVDMVHVPYRGHGMAQLVAQKSGTSTGKVPELPNSNSCPVSRR